jgi:hypothetical protein
MFMRNFNVVTRVAVVLSASLALAACGSDDIGVTAAAGDDVESADVTGALNGADAGGDDVAADVAADDVAVEDAATDSASDVVYKDVPFKTASHTALPQLVYGNVAVLHHPHIVTVTFANDPYADQFEKFAAQLQTTQWWDTWAVSFCSSTGNCVGKGDTDKVRLGTTAAKSYTDSTIKGGASTIQQFLKTRLDSAELPAPVTDTLYVIYFPQSTQITLGSGAQAEKSCQAFGGYHHSMDYGAGEIAYAILPECKSFGSGMTQLESAMFAASHEIAEAATDPYFTHTAQGGEPGGFNLNVNDWNVLPWEFALGGGENADLCPNLPYGGFGYAEENGYKLTRVWSNAAAKANHNPCVPADPGPYFNTAPEKNKGTYFKLAAGESTTIALHAFSDVPVKAWSVTAIDMDPFKGGGTALTFDFGGQDSLTVNNGDVVQLTVTRDGSAQPAAPYGAIAMIVSTSADGQSTNYWPIWTYTPEEYNYLTGK